MKARYLILFIALLTIVSFLPHGKQSQNMHDAFAARRKPKVLLIPRGRYSSDFMITEELGVMKTMLEDAGLKVVVATDNGEPYEGFKITVNVDEKFSDLDISDYVGIIMPCMARGLPGTVYPEVVQIVKEAVAKGIPVAAQYGSVVTLGEAGVLEGVQFAGPRMVSNSVVENKYMGFGVVKDGNIITSGTCPEMAKETGRPDGTKELTRLFIEAIKEQSH